MNSISKARCLAAELHPRHCRLQAMHGLCHRADLDIGLKDKMCQTWRVRMQTTLKTNNKQSQTIHLPPSQNLKLWRVQGPTPRLAIALQETCRTTQVLLEVVGLHCVYIPNLPRPVLDGAWLGNGTPRNPANDGWSALALRSLCAGCSPKKTSWCFSSKRIAEERTRPQMM